jgi:hypothetical protein
MIPPHVTFYGALQKKGVTRRRFLKFSEEAYGTHRSRSCDSY